MEETSRVGEEGSAGGFFTQKDFSLATVASCCLWRDPLVFLCQRTSSTLKRSWISLLNPPWLSIPPPPPQCDVRSPPSEGVLCLFACHRHTWFPGNWRALWWARRSIIQGWQSCSRNLTSLMKTGRGTKTGAKEKNRTAAASDCRSNKFSEARGVVACRWFPSAGKTKSGFPDLIDYNFGCLFPTINKVCLMYL